MMTGLLLAFGRPTIKSMEMLVQILARMGNGCRDYGVFIVSPLFHWKISHSVIKLRMSFFIPS
jgi:hypothetical protein